jgi:hypothetical protein
LKKATAIAKLVKGMELDENMKEKRTRLREHKSELSCIFEWHDGILVEAM